MTLGQHTTEQTRLPIDISIFLQKICQMGIIELDLASIPVLGGLSDSCADPERFIGQLVRYNS